MSYVPKEKIPEIKSHGELVRRCRSGDVVARAQAIVACSNLGMDGSMRDRADWRGALRGLDTFLESMAFEYGHGEAEAYRLLVEEVNGLRHCVKEEEIELLSKQPEQGTIK